MNIFPCRTVTPDGRSHTATRLVSDGRRFVVWALDDGEPVVVIDGDAATLTGTGPTWHAKLDAGTATITRDTTDCGCGHPFKQWTPAMDGAPSARRIYTDPESADA